MEKTKTFKEVKENVKWVYLFISILLLFNFIDAATNNEGIVKSVSLFILFSVWHIVPILLIFGAQKKSKCEKKLMIGACIAWYIIFFYTTIGVVQDLFSAVDKGGNLSPQIILLWLKPFLIITALYNIIMIHITFFTSKPE